MFQKRFDAICEDKKEMLNLTKKENAHGVYMVAGSTFFKFKLLFQDMELEIKRLNDIVEYYKEIEDAK